MPIKENHQMGVHENTTHVVFGSGDIRMTPAKMEGAEHDNCICFSQADAREISSITDEYIGKDTDSLPRPAVVLVFDKPESITALIHSLVELQEKYFPFNKS